MSPPNVPTRILAGTVVPDTPLITKVLAYTKAHASDLVYNHVVRGWLFGFQIGAKYDLFQDRDLEVHSVAALMHDLGWDNTGELISADKRFEVDGANAAREFLRKEGGKEWTEERLQLVWDCIALHTTPSIALHKESEVAVCCSGIFADFSGAKGSFGGLLTQDEYDLIVKEYPRTGFIDGVKDIFCGFCRTKPDVTYDNIVGDFGEKFVEGYTREGRTAVDLLMTGGRMLEAAEH